MGCGIGWGWGGGWEAGRASQGGVACGRGVRPPATSPAHPFPPLPPAAIDFLAACQHSDGGFGGAPGQLAHLAPTYAALAALATLVKAHGEVATAELVAALPDRIRAGEYNLDRSLQ